MRSRSVSRRSTPAASTLEGSLLRMRSRSAHRERGGQDWVSHTALTPTPTHTPTGKSNGWVSKIKPCYIIVMPPYSMLAAVN